MTIRIAHISDFHVREDWAEDQKVLISALASDLGELHAERPFDIVVFTGDLTFSATPNQFASARADFLDPIQALLELPRDRVIIVPGNHDIEKEHVELYVEEGMRVVLTSRAMVNELLDNADALARDRRLANWRDFHADYYASCPPVKAGPLAHVHTVDVRGATVAVATLNSAWRATGRPNDADRHHLLVGKRQVAATIAPLAAADLRIAAMHHPIDWLSAFDASDVKRFVASHFDILLTGHTHVSDPSGLALPMGEYAHSAAGALYESREFTNAYTILDVDLESDTAQLLLRTFQPKRQQFDMAVDVARNGRVELRLARGNRRTTVTDVVARDGSEPSTAAALLDSIRGRHVLAPLTDSDALDKIVVPPVFLPLPYEQYLAARDSDGSRRDHVDVLSLLADKRCVVIVGGAASGLTTTLSWLALKAFELRPDLAPLLVNAAGFRTGIDPMKRAANAALIEHGVPVDPKVALPPLVLAIDNLTEITRQLATRIATHVNNNAASRYLIGCDPHSDQQITEAFDKAGLDYVKVYLGPWGRKQIRALVDAIDADKKDRIRLAIERLLLRERMSRTPFNVAALISVVAQNESYDYANETPVINDYVNFLLQQREGDVDARLNMDSRDREHILSYLAEKMLFMNTTVLARHEVESLFAEYFAAVGWYEPPTRVLDALIRRLVLQEDDITGMVGFWQPSFLALFAAKRFIDDAQFRASLLEDPLSYPDVLRHAAFLKRNDRELLERVEQLLSMDSPGPEAGTLFELFADADEADQLFDMTDDGDEATSLDDEANADEGDGDDDDGDDDGEDDSFDERMDIMWDHLANANRHTAQSASASAEPVVRFQASLTLASSVLRNSELVDSTDLKRSVLERLLAGWADLVFRVAVNANRTDLRTVLAQMNFDGDIDEMADKVSVLAPIIYADTAMKTSLSSKRLERPLKALLDDPLFLQRPGPALMACLLAYQMRIANWTEYLMALVRQHAHIRVLYEMVWYVFVNGAIADVDYSPLESKGLEDVLVETILARQRFDNPAQRSKVAAGVRQEVKRMTLVNRAPNSRSIADLE